MNQFSIRHVPVALIIPLAPVRPTLIPNICSRPFCGNHQGSIREAFPSKAVQKRSFPKYEWHEYKTISSHNFHKDKDNRNGNDYNIRNNNTFHMRFTVHLLATLLLVHSRLLSCAFATEDCILTIEKNSETDFVLQEELPKECDNSPSITVNFPGDGNNAKAFQRIMSEGPSSKAIAYWSGQDFDDGSEFDFIRGNNEKMYGSIINLSTDTVVEIAHDADGDTYVMITPLSDFDDAEESSDGDLRRYLAEEDPDEDGNDERQSTNETMSRNLRGSNKVRVETSDMMNGVNIENTTAEPLRLEGQSQRNLLDDSGGNLDVMIVWTKRAECLWSRRSPGCSLSSTTHQNMENLILKAISEGNEAFQASGIQTRLHIAHSYRHPSFVEDRDYLVNLNHLTNRNGRMHDVHTKKSQYGADIVALIADHGSGIGQIGPSKNRMFSVSNYRSVNSQFTLIHEIGHNLGCEYL